MSFWVAAQHSCCGYSYKCGILCRSTCFVTPLGQLVELCPPYLALPHCTALCHHSRTAVAESVVVGPQGQLVMLDRCSTPPYSEVHFSQVHAISAQCLAERKCSSRISCQHVRHPSGPSLVHPAAQGKFSQTAGSTKPTFITPVVTGVYVAGASQQARAH